MTTGTVVPDNTQQGQFNRLMRKGKDNLAIELIRAIERIAALEQQRDGTARYIEDLVKTVESLELQLAAERAHNVTNAIRAFVTDGDIKSLNRFAECCDDPESGGHDLEKRTGNAA